MTQHPRPGVADGVGGGLALVVDDLACPLDGRPLRLVTGRVTCAADHSFDVARQGYVHLLPGPAPAAADTASMVAARAALQDAGHHRPLSEALASTVADAVAGSAGEAAASLARPAGAGEEAGGVAGVGEPRPAGGLVVDVGAGPGAHLAAVLDALPGTRGLAVDLSRYAARRAARRHPRAAAVVADVWRGLPIRTGAAQVVLDVFAPRHPEELARVTRPDGLLVVVTPGAQHLAPLVDELGLLRPAAGKTDHLDVALQDGFVLRDRWDLRWERALDPAAVQALVASGPSAHHVPPARVDRWLASAPLPVHVVFAATCSLYGRREG